MKKPIIEFEHLVDALRSLPGVGLKNAKKWAYHIINQDERYIKQFTDRIKFAHERIRKCSKCGNLSIELECGICSDKNRDHSTLCVVTSVEDLERIESSNSFYGLYHITNAELTIKQNNLVKHTNLDSIYDRVKNSPEIKEIIIATSFSHDGEMTAEYICNLLKNFKELAIYRIGFGVPLNGAIDYIDDETLKCSFNFKRKLS
ncbi:MAG: recombination protein RecR [Ureaplasma sp.]|nr:recombination protein RecR [Ureaplasma sp.]